MLVVAAAGNDYLIGNPVFYPAALLQPVGSNGVGGIGLAVAASTDSGERASFSNTGTYVSLAAPGDGVFSAVSSTSPRRPTRASPLPGSTRGLYGYGSGTSFAAPEVAGAAALVMAANPLLGATDVARVLKESASGAGAWTPELGFGVIDVAAAVALATGTTAEPSRAGLRLSRTRRQAARDADRDAVVARSPRSRAPAARIAFERQRARQVEAVLDGAHGCGRPRAGEAREGEDRREAARALGRLARARGRREQRPSTLR